MNMEVKETSIEIMGKMYQIKCPENEIPQLQRAAEYLEEKMIAMRQGNNFLNLERLAVITALNLAYQFLNIDNKNQDQAQNIQQRLINLQNKVESALGSLDFSLDGVETAD